MTRGKKGSGKSSEQKPAGTVGHNRISGEQVRPYLERIESIFGDMASAQGAYMAKCKNSREDIKEIYVEAKAAGIPKKALSTFVEERKLLNKIRENRAALEGDVEETFEQIVAALGDFGDLPLGAAALDAKRAARSSAVDSLGEDAGDQRQEIDAQRAAHATEFGGEAPEGLEHLANIKALENEQA